VKIIDPDFNTTKVVALFLKVKNKIKKMSKKVEGDRWRALRWPIGRRHKCEGRNEKDRERTRKARETVSGGGGGA